MAGSTIIHHLCTILYFVFLAGLLVKDGIKNLQQLKKVANLKII